VRLAAEIHFPKVTGDSTPRTSFSVNFLRVCRQTYEEATSMFYGFNRFAIGTYSTVKGSLAPKLFDKLGRDLQDAGTLLNIYHIFSRS
jgi:hypothetical protein